MAVTNADVARKAGEIPRKTAPVPIPYVVELHGGEAVKVWTLDAWHAVKAFPPEEQVRAAQTFWCESRWDKRVVGSQGEVDIPQVHPIHRELALRLGYTWEQVASDPEAAGVVARAVWDAQGWAGWGC